MDDFRWRELRVKLTEILVRATSAYVVGTVDDIFKWLDGVAADAVAAQAAGRVDLCEQVAFSACIQHRRGRVHWKGLEDDFDRLHLNEVQHAQCAITAAIYAFSATVACSRQLKPMSAGEAINLTADATTDVAEELMEQAIREEEEAKDPLLGRWQDPEERQT